MSSPSDPLPLLLPSCTTRYQTTSKMWALFKRPSIPPPPPCPFCLHPEPATRPPPPSLSWLPHNLPASSLAPFNPVCVQQLRLWKMSISSSHSAGLISSSALCNTISFWKSGPYPPPPPKSGLNSQPHPQLLSLPLLANPPQSLQEEIYPPPAGSLAPLPGEQHPPRPCANVLSSGRPSQAPH